LDSSPRAPFTPRAPPQPLPFGWSWFAQVPSPRSPPAARRRRCDRRACAPRFLGSAARNDAARRLVLRARSRSCWSLRRACACRPTH